MRIRVILAVTAAILVIAGVAGGYTVYLLLRPPRAKLTGFSGLVPYPGSPENALVLTQGGLIILVSLMGDRSPEVFADLTDRLGPDLYLEEGLLGLAFSPDFQENRHLYVNYTAGKDYASSEGQEEDVRRNVISRFTVRDGRLDLNSEDVLLTIPQPSSVHNGGQLAFGPDGYLYVGVGDGGGQGDPHENGQNPATVLGKILRLDVSRGDAYTIPPDNPFAGGGGAPEVFAYGFRNPWRFSFDRATGQLWAGDVGHNKWEEVDLVKKGGNYGWDCYEGRHHYEWTEDCQTIEAVAPRAEYRHSQGCAIIGGYVYRGTKQPDLIGRYVYGDFCSGRIWALDAADPGASPSLYADTDLSITSFAELPDGEMLVIGQGEGIYSLEPGIPRVLGDSKAIIREAGFEIAD